MPEEYLFYFSLACAAIVGGCVGSFLNVCIYRLPIEGLSVGQPRWSFCPLCEHRIRWHDNIPIFGWLALVGKCRDCKAKIAPRYPIVELITSGFFVLAALHVNVASQLPGFSWVFEALFWALLFSALIVVTFVDLDHRIIPDQISITGSALMVLPPLFFASVPVHADVPDFLRSWLTGVSLAPSTAAGAWWGGALDSWWGYTLGALLGGAGLALLFWRLSPAIEGGRRQWWETRLAFSVGAALGASFIGLVFVPDWLAGAVPTRLIAALFGMGIGAGSLFSVGVLGSIAFKKDAMGLGDVKLMALLGAVLGWKGVLLAVFVACLLGSVIGIAVKLITRSSYIPFGPFLAAGALTLILWHQQVDAGLAWYLDLVRPR